MTEEEFRYGGKEQADTRRDTTRSYDTGAKPFQRHDSRNQVMEANSVLQGLRHRIDRIASTVADGLHGVAGHLEDHADRVHGVPPPQPASGSRGLTDAPCYGEGQLGDLQRSIDNLEGTLEIAASRVAVAAGRNTTLA